MLESITEQFFAMRKMRLVAKIERVRSKSILGAFKARITHDHFNALMHPSLFAPIPSEASKSWRLERRFRDRGPPMQQLVLWPPIES